MTPEVVSSLNEEHVAPTSAWTATESKALPQFVSARQGGPRYPRGPYQFAKRGVDVIVGGVGLVCLFPVFALIAATVAAQDGFPVVFRQKRLGRNGKPFYILKFRTMVKNAEEVLKSRPDLMEEYRQTYKIENDPRILRVGRFLRASSLDELPQLLNVVKGEMSLVGPRPIVEAEIEKYGEDGDVYMAMKPGCAGLWQCSGRSLTTYKERVAFDREYFEGAGLRQDALILIKTLWSIACRRGAR